MKCITLWESFYGVDKEEEEQPAHFAKGQIQQDDAENRRKIGEAILGIVDVDVRATRK